MNEYKPKPLPQFRDEDIARFWAKVERRGLDDCWLWQASVINIGYGAFRIAHRTVRANRIAYFLATGSDPLAALVCHSCDTPRCCNPRHLFLGSTGDNQRDKCAKGRNVFPPPRNGPANNNYWLTPEIVAKIRTLSASGQSYRKIAIAVGCHKDTVQRVIARKGRFASE